MSQRRNILLLAHCLFSFTWITFELQSPDHLMVFALLGDSITLPCAIPSISFCSSINWNMAEQFQAVTNVVKAGRVTSPNTHRLVLLTDCSLKINHLVHNDARLYSCDSGTLNSSVSLQILEIAENPAPAQGTIELQCFLSIYKGYIPCNNTRLQIKWSTEDNTPINGNRFRIENPSECFSKMTINKKLTDHHRQWKCHLTQNDIVKASISYTTTVRDGIEEVFAAVGESVSLSCTNTSSLGVSVMWTVGGRSLTDDIPHHKEQLAEFHVNQGSSLVISKVSALHGGDYRCSAAQKEVLNKIRLHILDVTAECEPGGENLTLTCLLICPKECEKDFHLTWSGNSQNSWESNSMSVNNTLINKLFLPVRSMRSDGITCFVHREGAVVALKKWHYVNSLQTLAWLALPLCLLTFMAAGGLCMQMKRKRNKDAVAAGEQSSFKMNHVYEVIQDVNIKEPQQQGLCQREAAATDSFYHLLQAVN